MTTSPWVEGLWAAGYYGPLSGWGASLDEALDDLERQCAERAPGANWCVGLEISVDLELGRWRAAASTAKLEPRATAFGGC